MTLNHTSQQVNPSVPLPPPGGAEHALRLGSKGPQVSTLQLRLLALNYNVGKADGDFGPKTQEAVKAFQSARSLVVDGIVGPKTAAALGLKLSASVQFVSQHTADSPASGSKSISQGKTQVTSSDKSQAKALVEKFVSSWSSDEAGLANALYTRSQSVNLLIAAFELLEDEYSEDSDDVALEYVKLVKTRGGAPRELVRKEATFRELLIHCLSSGVPFPDEHELIQYLRELGGSTGSSSTDSPMVEAMVQAALAQAGKSYEYGAEVKASDTQAKAFDCSELVEWAVSQAGGYIPDGSQAQREWCRKHKTTLPVEQAIKTRGALLFTDSHVAISLGDGKTIEAANKKKGVCSLNAAGRGWKEAGLVPGLAQGASISTPPPKTPAKTESKTTSTTKVTSTGQGSAGDVINGHVIYPNEVRAQGTLAWRNNNPGNIRNSRFTNMHGAFKGKSNRGFAIFPNHGTGFAALIALLKTDSYRPLSVAAAMKRYAPSEDSNDPVAYARTVSKLTGLDVSKTLESLTDGELEKFAKAIQKVEGWKAGTIYSLNDPRLVEVGIKLASGNSATTTVTQATKAASSSGTALKGTTGVVSQAAVKLVPTPGSSTGKVTQAPAGANQETLKKLGKVARKRLTWENKGLCAKGVCEMLGEVGYLYGQDRPRVATGIVNKVYDYGTGQWIPATTVGLYVSNHSCIDKNTQTIKAGTTIKSASASDSAKFMRHTLKAFKFVECTPLLPGHGGRGTAPAESVKALSALPEGAVVVFGPALSRSVRKSTGGVHTVGGTGHAGHVGVLVREGNEVLVVADGLLASGQKYTVELCLKNYAWAVGFVPTTEPLKLMKKDLPSSSL